MKIFTILIQTGDKSRSTHILKAYTNGSKASLFAISIYTNWKLHSKYMDRPYPAPKMKQEVPTHISTYHCLPETNTLQHQIGHIMLRDLRLPPRRKWDFTLLGCYAALPGGYLPTSCPLHVGNQLPINAE